jgi:hypothetical protein
MLETLSKSEEFSIEMYTEKNSLFRDDMSKIRIVIDSRILFFNHY